MNYNQDITAQWQELTAIIESEVIRDLRSSNKVDTDKLNLLFEEEKSKWLSGINYRGVWLQTVRKTDPIFVDRFVKALEAVVILHPMACRVSIYPYVLIAVVFIIITIAIVFQFEMPLWKYVIGVLLCFSSSYVMAFSLYKSRIRRMIQAISLCYKNTMNQILDSLIQNSNL